MPFFVAVNVLVNIKPVESPYIERPASSINPPETVVPTRPTSFGLLAGVTSLAGLERSHVCKGEPVYPPGLHSAFPLMQLPQAYY